MGESNSIINLGDLSKPANTLIEKISDALGGIFRPYQIRRVAQAEAEADKIKAISQVEVTDIQRRALHRFLAEEAKKQNNIEAITRKALPEVSNGASPQNVEDDWITNFFDKCRLVSDGQMQNLWSKVLAGEANAPGNYSKRTVNLLAGLDKLDAELFAKLCSFGFFIGELTLLIYDVEQKIYTDHGVNFSTLSHLDSIGLIHFDSLVGYRRFGLGQRGFVTYYGTRVWIGFAKPHGNELTVGHARLTKAGQQLAPICGSKPREGFVQYVQEKWKALGYEIEQNSAQTAPAQQSPSAS